MAARGIDDAHAVGPRRGRAAQHGIDGASGPVAGRPVPGRALGRKRDEPVQRRGLCCGFGRYGRGSRHSAAPVGGRHVLPREHTVAYTKLGQPELIFGGVGRGCSRRELTPVGGCTVSGTLAIVGAGAKAVAVAAKAAVLREMGVEVPEVVAVERAEVAANWRAGGGWTD